VLAVSPVSCAVRLLDVCLFFGRSVENLGSYLEELNTWVLTRIGQVGSWSQVRVAEDTTIRRQGRDCYIAQSSLFTPEDYAPRFDALLSQGYSWLNMNWAGIVGDTLIIVIELPVAISGIAGKTSVNFSGPRLIDGKPQWNAAGFITVT
jgi:hypothetical protein